MFQPAFDIDLDIDPMWCSWFTGFADGESSFQLGYRYKTSEIFARFTIGLRDDDIYILQEIQSVLKCGKINRISTATQRANGVKAGDTATWDVRDIGGLRMILVPLFNKYPLKTKKVRDYKVWREAVYLLYSSKHRKQSKKLIKLTEEIKKARAYQSPIT